MIPSLLVKVFKIQLLLNRCFYGAVLCACSAIYTCICIDNIDAISFSDSFYGAVLCTCSARYASVSNPICHFLFLL